MPAGEEGLRTGPNPFPFYVALQDICQSAAFALPAFATASVACGQSPLTPDRPLEASRVSATGLRNPRSDVFRVEFRQRGIGIEGDALLLEFFLFLLELLNAP